MSDEELPKPAPTKRPKPSRSNVIDLDAQEGMSQAEKDWLTKAGALGLPVGVKGDEARKWAEDKLVELLPEAVANVAWNLRHGDRKEKAEATDKILKANGLDRREAPTATGGLIVLNLGGDAATEKVPWLQRLQKSKAK